MKKPVRRITTSGKTVAKKPQGSANGNKKPPANGGKVKSGFDRGAAGFEKAEKKRAAQEADYQRRKDTPFSFKLKPGDSAEVIILDKGDPFFLNMHKVKDSRGRWVDEVCIADTGQRCPICETTGKEGSYTMVTTILDRRPYKTKDGKTIKNSKKLMFVKGRNLPKFKRQYEGKANGNFRGLKLNCHRDGDKESSMGEDIEFLGRVSEEFLSKFGDNAKPADYTKIFKMPTADELRKRYNLKASGGGKVVGGEEFSDDEDGYSADDVGWNSDDE